MGRARRKGGRGSNDPEGLFKQLPHNLKLLDDWFYTSEPGGRGTAKGYRDYLHGIGVWLDGRGVPQWVVEPVQVADAGGMTFGRWIGRMLVLFPPGPDSMFYVPPEGGSRRGREPRPKPDLRVVKG